MGKDTGAVEGSEEGSVVEVGSAVTVVVVEAVEETAVVKEAVMEAVEVGWGERGVGWGVEEVVVMVAGMAQKAAEVKVEVKAVPRVSA